MSEMELRGLPTVFVATVEFVDGAERQQKALGADLASVFVEHPIQDRSDAEMNDIAERALGELIEKLLDAGA
jgi:hypothetical protein